MTQSPQDVIARAINKSTPMNIAAKAVIAAGYAVVKRQGIGQIKAAIAEADAKGEE